MLIDAEPQIKRKKQGEATNGTPAEAPERNQMEHPDRCRKTPLGDSLSTAKFCQFRRSLSPCALCKKKCYQRAQKEHQRDQRFCQNGAPASPIREHKWSSRKYNQRPQNEHQRDQRFCQNGAPTSLIREQAWNTRKCSQRPPKKHQRDQRIPEVLPKRSTSKSNQKAQMKYQKV